MTLLPDHVFEEVGRLGGGLGFQGGGQSVMFGVAVLLEDQGDGAFHQGGLGGVGSHGCNSGRQNCADIQRVRPWGGDVAEAAFDEEACGEVVETLRGVQLAQGREALR